MLKQVLKVKKHIPIDRLTTDNSENGTTHKNCRALLSSTVPEKTLPFLKVTFFKQNFTWDWFVLHFCCYSSSFLTWWIGRGNFIRVVPFLPMSALWRPVYWDIRGQLWGKWNSWPLSRFSPFLLSSSYIIGIVNNVLIIIIWNKEFTYEW